MTDMDMDQTQEGAEEAAPMMPEEGADMGEEATPAGEAGDEAAA